MKIGVDPRKLVIVIVPPQNSVHPVWLMALDDKGDLDWDSGSFGLTLTGDESSAFELREKLG